MDSEYLSWRDPQIRDPDCPKFRAMAAEATKQGHCRAGL
jgi:hypothetical protein